MKKTPALHPFLFVVFNMLFFYSHNVQQIRATEMVVPGVIILIVTAIMWALLFLLLKNIYKSALLLTVFLLLFFSYGHAYTVVKNVVISHMGIGAHTLLLLVCVLVISIATYLVWIIRSDLRMCTKVLNEVGICLLVLPTAIILLHIYKSGRIDISQTNVNEFVSDGTTFGLDHSNPDIYYIILDGYANEGVLKELYGYDNSDFRTYLAGKGFYVAQDSRCNYPATPLSLASSLNMDYLDLMSLEQADAMIRDNIVTRILKRSGYKYIHFSSGWGPTDYNENADWNIRCGRWNEFSMVLIRNTMLWPFYVRFLGDEIRRKILCTFAVLPKVKERIGRPRFVLVHINCPHPPFVFGRNGEAVQGTKYDMSGNVWLEKELYIDQLIYVNKKIMALVDLLLVNDNSHPIIILQSDHGPNSLGAVGGSFPPSRQALSERMKIFNAYYLPGEEDTVAYSTITPVNTFRMVLNCYFGTKYELLDDVSYILDRSKQFRFIDVTKRIE